jgi:Fur family zinc uptake transcriptional regulator
MQPQDQRARRLAVAEAICGQLGERPNAPSRRVLRALYAGGRPLKAYDLMHDLSSGGRAAAPPTVYRALKVLIDAGLAHRVESLNAFIACRFPGQDHLAGFHVCESCGSAEEFQLSNPPPEVAEPGPARLIFEVLRYCQACGDPARSPTAGRAV